LGREKEVGRETKMAIVLVTSLCSETSTCMDHSSEKLPCLWELQATWYSGRTLAWISLISARQKSYCPGRKCSSCYSVRKMMLRLINVESILYATLYWGWEGDARPKEEGGRKWLTPTIYIMSSHINIATDILIVPNR
jgi:hypothetical protein